MVWNLGRRRSAGDELLMKHSTSAYGIPPPATCTSTPSTATITNGGRKSVVVKPTVNISSATTSKPAKINKSFRTTTATAAAAAAAAGTTPTSVAASRLVTLTDDRSYYGHLVGGQNRNNDSNGTSILASRSRRSHGTATGGGGSSGSGGANFCNPTTTSNTMIEDGKYYQDHSLHHHHRHDDDHNRQDQYGHLQQYHHQQQGQSQYLTTELKMKQIKNKKRSFEQHPSPPPKLRNREEPVHDKLAKPVSFNRSQSAPHVVTTAASKTATATVAAAAATTPKTEAEAAETRSVVTANTSSELTERIERLERELYKSQKQQQKQQEKIQQQERQILRQQQQQQQQQHEQRKKQQEPKMTDDQHKKQQEPKMAEPQRKKQREPKMVEPPQTILNSVPPPQVPIDPPPRLEQQSIHTKRRKDPDQSGNLTPQDPQNNVDNLPQKQTLDSSPNETSNDTTVTSTPTQLPLKSSLLQRPTTNEPASKSIGQCQEDDVANTSNYVDGREDNDDVHYHSDGENLNEINKKTSSLTPLQWQRLKKSSTDRQQKKEKQTAVDDVDHNNDTKRGRGTRKLLSSFARRPPFSGVNNKRNKGKKVPGASVPVHSTTSLNHHHQATPKASNVAVSEATSKKGSDQVTKRKNGTTMDKFHQLFSPVSDLSGSFDATEEEDETVSGIIGPTHNPFLSSSAMVCLFPNLLDTHVVEIEVGPQCNAPMNERMIGDYIGENGHCVSSPLNEGLVGDYKLSCHGATRGFERFDAFGDEDEDDDSFISQSDVPKEVKLMDSEENSIVETDNDDDDDDDSDNNDTDDDSHREEDVGLNGRDIFKPDGKMLLDYANEEDSIEDRMENKRGVFDRYSSGGDVNVNNRTVYVPLPGLAKPPRRKTDLGLASGQYQSNKQKNDKLSRSRSVSDRNFDRSSSSDNSRLGISPRVVEELTEYNMVEENKKAKCKSMPPNLKIKTKQNKPSSEQRPVLSPRRLFQRRNIIFQENEAQRIDFGDVDVDIDTKRGGYDGTSPSQYSGQSEDRPKAASFYDRILSLSPRRTQTFQRKGRMNHSTTHLPSESNNDIVIKEYQARDDWVQAQVRNIQETAPEDDWQPRPDEDRKSVSSFNADWQQPDYRHRQYQHHQQHQKQQQNVPQRHHNHTHNQHPSHASAVTTTPVRSEQNGRRSRTLNRSRSRSRSRSPSKFFNDLLRMKPTNDDIIEDLLQLEEKFPEVAYA